MRDTALHLSGVENMMFRINRDLRFTKDKSPFLTHVSGLLTRDGTKHTARGLFYVHLDAHRAGFASVASIRPHSIGLPHSATGSCGSRMSSCASQER